MLPRVITEWGITRLCYEADTEPYARARDEAIRAVAVAAGVEVHEVSLVGNVCGACSDAFLSMKV